MKQRKRDLLKEDFQYFSRTEIEEAAGELQSDINRLHDELKAAGLEENKIISEILRRIEEVRDLPQRYLEAVDLREKGGILRELVSLLTLSDTEIQIHWKEPYSYLMREDLISAVSSGVAAVRTTRPPRCARPRRRKLPQCPSRRPASSNETRLPPPD